MSVGVFSLDSTIMSIILILIIALINSVYGNKDNTTINHCAAYKDPVSIDYFRNKNNLDDLRFVIGAWLVADTRSNFSRKFIKHILLMYFY